MTKLNASLSSLVYSTYTGGTYFDSGDAIAVDAQGNAYVTGATFDVPVTPGALSSTGKVFLTEFDPTGANQKYSTRLGGTDSDIPKGIALDSSGAVYLAGESSSSNFPTTPGAYQTSVKDGEPGKRLTAPKAFVVKLDLTTGQPCSVSFSPAGYAAPVNGGTVSIAITAPAGCPWTLGYPNSYLTSLLPFIFSATHGFGNSTVSITVQSNVSSTNSVSIGLLLGPSIFTITQPAGSCSTPLISPTSASFGTQGALGALSVSMPGGCLLRAASTTPWARIVSTTSNNTDYGVAYSVDRNDFGARSASFTINGVTVPFSQAGSGCTSSASLSAGSDAVGGTGFVSLTTSGAGCAWNAYASVPWIQVPSTQGTGSSVFGITLAPNPGIAPRTGQIFIAGQTLSVSQAAGPVGTPATYTIATIAGTGESGFSGDGGLAVDAKITSANDIAFDAANNLLIADIGNSRIRKVGTGGIISTIAGSGSLGMSGDGGPATAAGISQPFSVAVGPSGDIFISPFEPPTTKLRKVSGGTIGTLATGVSFRSLAVDSSNNVYSGGDGYIQKISPQGVVSVVAGNGTFTSTGDGGPPASATVNYVQGLSFDASGNLFVSESGRIRKISGNVIQSVGGSSALGIANDAQGNVVFADFTNRRIKRLTANGIVTTIAGNDAIFDSASSNGDGGLALTSAFSGPVSVAVDTGGNIAVADYFGSRVRLLTPAYTFCSFALSSAAGSIASGAGTLNPSVTAGTGCAWSILSTVNWITPVSSPVTGSGTAGISVAPNTTSSPRTGTVNIAGQTFTVTQSGSTPPVASLVSLTPTSGSAAGQTFTAVFSDTGGASVLNRRLLLINSMLNGAGGCFVQVDGSGVYLVNDSGSALLGKVSPGGGSIANSQCTLNGTGTGVTNSGNTSTVAVSLTFGPKFTGPKTIYLYAEDDYGNTGFQPFGSYTVPPPSAPQAVSVDILPGSPSVQFTANYTEEAGAIYLKRRLLLINSNLAGGGACFVQGDNTGIYLVSDNGSTLLGPVAVGSGVTNSQCTLFGTGASLINSVNHSTLVVSLSFKPAFAGTKNLYAYTEDSFGHDTGFQLRGTYSVPFAVPSVDSVTAASASGATQTFTAVYSDVAGAAFFNRRLLVINSVLNGAGACFVQADTNGIYLVNDAGSGLLGPVTGSATVANSQCTLNGTGTNVANSGTISTLTLSITFKPTFAGSKSIYMYAEDVKANNSGFQTRGTYVVPFAVPTADSVTPSSEAGLNQTFTAVYSDASGASALKRRLFLINSSLNGTGACFIQADQSGVYLLNDADNAILGPVTAGNSVTNSQCTLNGTGTGLSDSGGTSTLTISILFKTAFAGAKSIYLYADDSAGNNSGFQTRGTYFVSGTPSSPTVTSVTPNSGSGANRTFTLVYSDPAGNSLLNRRLFLIKSSLNGTSACLVQVDTHGIFLANDLASALIGPLFTNSSLTNSRCILNGSGASVSYSSTSTTVVLPITFQPGFGGIRNLYMYVDDTVGNASGWQLMGAITTQ